jgi:hypothetical protein
MRVDVPTLRCDRCSFETQDQNLMGGFNTLKGQWNGYQGTKQEWDLCPECWKTFKMWVGADIP